MDNYLRLNIKRHQFKKEDPKLLFNTTDQFFNNNLDNIDQKQNEVWNKVKNLLKISHIIITVTITLKW